MEVLCALSIEAGLFPLMFQTNSHHVRDLSHNSEQSECIKFGQSMTGNLGSSEVSDISTSFRVANKR